VLGESCYHYYKYEHDYSDADPPIPSLSLQGTGLYECSVSLCNSVCVCFDITASHSLRSVFVEALTSDL